MKRLLNLLGAMSLLLCVAACALWVRSERFTDVWSYYSANTGYRVMAFVGQGHIEIFFPANGSAAGFGHAVYTADAMPSIPAAGLGSWLGFSIYRTPPTGVAIPFWFVAIACALPASPWVFRRRHKLRGHCSICGYDLRASPERCPECGTLAAANRELA